VAWLKVASPDRRERCAQAAPLAPARPIPGRSLVWAFHHCAVDQQCRAGRWNHGHHRVDHGRSAGGTLGPPGTVPEVQASLMSGAPPRHTLRLLPPAGQVGVRPSMSAGVRSGGSAIGVLAASTSGTDAVRPPLAAMTDLAAACDGGVPAP